MRRVTSGVVLAVLSGLVLAGLGAGPSEARAPSAQRGPASATPAAGLVTAPADSARKKKQKKRKKKRTGATSRCWPGTPALRTARLSGVVRYTWAGTSCTSRYRVRVSPAWWGQWPGAPRYTAWVPGTARSTDYRVPTRAVPGDGMTAVAYANPVFAQLEANNGLHKRRVATRRSSWVPQWAVPPAPKPGDAVRFGSYNVMVFPTGKRNDAVARNIGSHGLTMAALQEARQTTAAEIVSRLNGLYAGEWSYVRADGGPGQQIIYRSDLFTLVDSGVMSLANPKDSRNPVTAPYAGFRARQTGGRLGQVFHVTSLHYLGTPTSSLGQNVQTGAAAQVTVNFLKRFSGPVIAAGDLRYGREPWGDRPGYVPAQPTFVRSGYYDAMAAQSMRGQNYSTFNGQARQVPHKSGAGPRCDHILMRGIVGSRSYVNVANFSYGGVIPSDHNLIYSDLMIPYAPAS